MLASTISSCSGGSHVGTAEPQHSYFHIILLFSKFIVSLWYLLLHAQVLTMCPTCTKLFEQC